MCSRIRKMVSSRQPSTQDKMFGFSIFAMDDSNKVRKEMVEGALGVIVA